MKIIVSKFGGTSMGSDLAMLRSAEVVKERNSSLVVVSATSGTTDRLLALILNAENKDWEKCQNLFFDLREKHFEICHKLTANPDTHEKIKSSLTELETIIRGVYLLGECTPRARDQVLSFGELLSSMLFAEALKNICVEKEIMWLDVRDVLITDANFGKATPLIEIIQAKAKEKLNFNSNRIYITQGFIGKNQNGATTVLGRGGSDYSAALLAEAVNASVLEIWTDVAGIATTDPRICPEAQIISEITYNEASEMAQYGAKVLHPTTLWPAMRKNIPVFVGSSFDKAQAGTWIKTNLDHLPLVRAITKRGKQALLIIQTPKMLNAFGFMANIFEVFAKHRISVDCVTTSEISVAITVELETLEHKEFIRELELIGELKIENNYSLISIVGNGMLDQAGIGKNVFIAIGDINVRMMGLGASAYNFNFLVKEEEANLCIKRLHQFFIEKTEEKSLSL